MLFCLSSQLREIVFIIRHTLIFTGGKKRKRKNSERKKLVFFFLIAQRCGCALRRRRSSLHLPEGGPGLLRALRVISAPAWALQRTTSAGRRMSKLEGGGEKEKQEPPVSAARHFADSFKVKVTVIFLPLLLYNNQRQGYPVSLAFRAHTRRAPAACPTKGGRLRVSAAAEIAKKQRAPHGWRITDVCVCVCVWQRS